jgi:hypothetical protein
VSHLSPVTENSANGFVAAIEASSSLNGAYIFKTLKSFFKNMLVLKGSPSVFY